MPAVLWRTLLLILKAFVAVAWEREKTLRKWDVQEDINLWSVKRGNNRKGDIDQLTEKVVALQSEDSINRLV